MSETVAALTLLTQLETALHRLVESFWEEPYRFFTEADAVAALHTWIARRPELAQAYHTADGFETGLLHREYPTFFRFKVSDPSQRLGPPATRGDYDLALINPAYVRNHDAEAVGNRGLRIASIYRPHRCWPLLRSWGLVEIGQWGWLYEAHDQSWGIRGSPL